MNVSVNGRRLIMLRDEADSPVVETPYPRPNKPKPGEYNSWRKDYYLRFETEALAKKALETVQQLADFDKAAAWLDR